MEKVERKIKNIISALKRNEEESSEVGESVLNEYGLQGIFLRPYQLEGIQWMISRYKTGLGFILADEMGLGKTLQTISFLVYLYGIDRNLSPSLILLPLSLLSNWKAEFKRFAPQLKLICYVGSKDERAELRHKLKNRNETFNIIISTYEICLKDDVFLSALTWHLLIVDEGHRLKNRQSQLYLALLNFQFDYRLILTGTPVQNSLDELYSLLSFVQPDIFHYKFADQFIETYGDICASTSLEDSDVVSRNMISTILFPFLLRRVKSQVLKDMPKKTEVILYHGLTSLQKKYYKAILTKDIEAFDSVAGVKRTQLRNILMQLRKCVSHPYLFDGVEPEPFQLGDHLVEASGKFIILDRLLNFLYQNKHKVLIFSQMTRVLDIVQDYMGLRGFPYERLDGSVRAEERFIAVQNFNEVKSTFAFLLSTKAGGQGLNLTAADTVIFIDSDFNPQNDLQAAARAHRIGQLRNVKVIRLVGRSTVEEIILKRAEDKLLLTKAVTATGQSTSASGIAKYDDDFKMEDIVKYGLDKLFENDDCSLEDVIDFTSILGPTLDGEWQVDTTGAAADDVILKRSDEDEVLKSDINLYFFEGRDYSKEPSAADLRVFQNLIEVEKSSLMAAVESIRTLRSKKSFKLHNEFPLDLPARKPRKQATPLELEERRRKRAERAANRAKEEEEEEIRRDQERRRQRKELWQQNNYTSCNLQASSDEDLSDDSSKSVDRDEKNDDSSKSLDSEEENSNEMAIQYVVGDVTHPKYTNDKNAIVVHCLDDSGIWGSGGLFTSLIQRSLQPEEQYTKAGKMKDLALGDVHIVSIDDIQSRQKGRDWAALIIAQKRDSRSNHQSGIKLSALQLAFQKLSKYARAKKASVHFPRIGHNTVGFNWYGTERLIRKYFTVKHIPTFIYYFDRSIQRKKRQLEATDEPKQKKHLTEDQSTSRSMTHSLPDFLHGVVVYFHGVSDEIAKKLTRFIIAFDGEVLTSLNLNTSHIIMDDNVENKESIAALMEEHHANSSIKIIKVQWILECLKKGYLLDTEQYLVL